MTQLVTRVDDELVAQLDELVADKVIASRSEAVRLALARLVDAARRKRIEEAIIEGYRRIPQTDEETEMADVAARQMIVDEPW
jgi:metal-responsive CopG/Arc/MetJ family transcriptional regulator